MTHQILILGSSGTVGHHLTRILLEKGEQVKAASRHPETLPALTGLERVAFDFSDPSTFDAALEGVDRLFTVAPAGVLQAYDLLAPVLKAAQQRGIKIVLQTAIGVEADDNIPLRKVELLLEGSGLPYVILRPNWFSDNFHTYWAQDVEAGLIRLPAADARTSFIDARDIARSAAAALTSSAFDGRAFILTGPEGLSYAEAAQVLTKVAGRTIRYEASTPEEFVQTMVKRGMPEDYARNLAFIFGAVVQGWLAAPTPHVQELTGRPPYSLQDYAEHHREKFQQKVPQA
ncbi:SDR family oxidoreductase [Deinococcus cellulosilyticus]|uniref:NAD(P)-dependent oxidoreductase n=1 Tax=Deinococcus cellulosilyticus (strain DSM 18568 / NBRC 106333 / KACC 11606 / 5516J-15) TaxID=1223518 RepID=A0A511MYA5_DEIC1|nr:SDR family oxidoreductase [Deinococcus cellulosilyticus]GEM45575.1 NAD(P)-dependent oxidoreductase [Deinococcus cellulosilyticus NBRC 106333 = KACC 11606]